MCAEGSRKAVTRAASQVFGGRTRVTAGLEARCPGGRRGQEGICYGNERSHVCERRNPGNCE